MSTNCDNGADVEIARLVDRLMRRLETRLNRTATTFDHYGVGPIGGLVLLTLSESEPIGVQAMAGNMGRDKSQMTRIVQLLEGKGLVARDRAATDGRVSMLSLTPAGRDAVAAIEGGVAAALTEILAPLDREERSALKVLLQRL